MNNLKVGLKKFLANKNTVTMLGIFAIILVLYVGYNAKIRQAITPVSVPFALKTIAPRTKITSDMIGIMDIPSYMLKKGNPATNENQVIGKYSNYDSVIPAGSLFYRRSIVSQEALPDSILKEIPDGQVLVNMPLDLNTSYGNKIIPGNYVDIYLKAINKLDSSSSNKQDKIMVGKLLTNIKILDVLDSNGMPVFENLEAKRTPAMMLFAVPEEYHILIRKAMYLRTFDATLLPIPTKESLKEQPGEVKISNEELKDWINKVTYWTEEM